MAERSGFLPVTVIIPDEKPKSGCIELIGYLIGIAIIFGFLMGGLLR